MPRVRRPHRRRAYRSRLASNRLRRHRWHRPRPIRRRARSQSGTDHRFRRAQGGGRDGPGRIDRIPIASSIADASAAQAAHATCAGRYRQRGRRDQRLVHRRQRAGQGRHARADRRRRRAAQVRVGPGLAARSDRAAPGRRRGRGDRGARVRMARTHAPALVRPQRARRRDRPAADDRVRRVPSVPASAGNRRVRADARARRRHRRARGAAGCARARGARTHRGLRRADPDLDRRRQSRRSFLVLRAAQSRDPRDRLAQGLARAEPARLRVHLGDRHGMGRAALRALAFRQHRAVPGDLLRDLSRDPDSVRAAPRSGAARSRRRHARVRQSADRLRAAGRAARRRAHAARVFRAGARGRVCAARRGPDPARAHAPPRRIVRGARGRIRDARGAARAQRALDRLHVRARRRRARLARIPPAAPAAALERHRPADPRRRRIPRIARVRRRQRRHDRDRERRLHQRGADRGRRVHERMALCAQWCKCAICFAAVLLGTRLVARRGPARDRSFRAGAPPGAGAARIRCADAWSRRTRVEPRATPRARMDCGDRPRCGHRARIPVCGRGCAPVRGMGPRGFRRIRDRGLPDPACAARCRQRSAHRRAWRLGLDVDPRARARAAPAWRAMRSSPPAGAMR